MIIAAMMPSYYAAKQIYYKPLTNRVLTKDETLIISKFCCFIHYCMFKIA